jgi:hypothetical protein
VNCQKPWFFILLSFVTLAGSFASAQTATRSKTAAAKPSSPLSFGGSYLFSTDTLKDQEKRENRHRLELGVGYRLRSDLALGLENSLQWYSDGSNVPRQEDNPKLDDLEMSLAKSGDLPQVLKYKVYFANAFPTGYDSRTEGTRNTFTLGGGLSTQFLKESLSIGLGASISVLSQSFDYSPTSGESNPESVNTTILSTAWKPIKYFSMDISYTLWNVRTMNGENFLTRNQSSIGLKYSWAPVTASLRYSIGNYDKGDGFKLFYQDQMRQIVTLGVGFEI